MNVKPESWNAFQIGQGGAYAGRTVSFMHEGTLITGTLESADSPPGATYAYLVVDGKLYSVTKMTLVEVR